MHSVCCVCGVEYGTKPCEPEQDGALSHGICPSPQCLEDFKHGRKHTKEAQ